MRGRWGVQRVVEAAGRKAKWEWERKKNLITASSTSKYGEEFMYVESSLRKKNLFYYWFSAQWFSRAFFPHIFKRRRQRREAKIFSVLGGWSKKGKFLQLCVAKTESKHILAHTHFHALIMYMRYMRVVWIGDVNRVHATIRGRKKIPHMFLLRKI